MTTAGDHGHAFGAGGIADDQATDLLVYPRADWTRVSRVYDQCLTSLNDESESAYLPSALPAFLAELLSRLSAGYYGAESAFISDALQMFSTVDGIEPTVHSFAQLYTDNRFSRLAPYSAQGRGGRRRRPTPFEATVETARRLRDLNSIEQRLGSKTTAALLGGSASYGRFFNVVGTATGTPSDLDLLIVIEEPNELLAICSCLEQMVGVDLQSLENFRVRATEYLDSGVAMDFDAVAFSGKISIWTTHTDEALRGSGIDPRYELSFHIVTTDVFRKLTLADVPKISKQLLGSTRMIMDYREQRVARLDHQRNFGGGNLRLALDTQESGKSFLRSSHMFYIDRNSQYYPGMFQNLILPQYDVRWGTTATRRLVETMRWKMVERLRHERQIRPEELLRISFAHTRSEVFAPHTVRSVDQSTILS